MKNIYFEFESSLGLLSVFENSYKIDEQMQTEASFLVHSRHEPLSHLTPIQYGRLLLKTTTTKANQEALTDEEVEQLTLEDIQKFAQLYATLSRIKINDDALTALYRQAITNEHFYHDRAGKIKSPFSLSTTLASLHSYDQPIEERLRNYWEYQKNNRTKPLSRKLTDFLAVKHNVEEIEQELNNAITLDDLYKILMEQNNSQFKRDIETKKTVNRNLTLALIALVVGVVNLLLNLSRYIFGN